MAGYTNYLYSNSARSFVLDLLLYLNSSIPFLILYSTDQSKPCMSLHE